MGLRLVRALAMEMHKNRLEARRYRNMEDLKGHTKITLRAAAEPVCVATPLCQT